MPGVVSFADAVYRRLIEDSTGYAIALLDGNGKIETWNRGAEILFGYRADEVIGQHISVIFPEEDRAAVVPSHEIDKACSTGRAEAARWLVRKDGSQRFVDGVMTAIKDEAGRTLGLAYVTRDITDRNRTEQRLATQLALTNVLNEDLPFDATARRIMQTVSEHLGWQIGVLWEIQPDQSARFVDLWHAPDVRPEIPQQLVAMKTMPAGIGMPGAVVKSRKPVWVTNFSGESFPRAPIAARGGLIGAFGFPITSQGRVTGVMEFFSREQNAPDPELLPVMELVGAQIGEFVERRRTAEALRESEERYRAVTETAQDAIFTIDRQSKILMVNRAVERMFGYTPEELIGKSLDVLIPKAMRQRHRDGVEHFVRTRERRIPWTGVELPGLHRDGHEIPLEIAFGFWEGLTGPVFTGFARDITDRKHAQRQEQEARAQIERRAEEEESFRHLASALNGAVEMSDVLYEVAHRASLVARADGVYVERLLGPDHMVEIVSVAGHNTPPRGLRVDFPGSMTEEILRGRKPVILADMREFGRSMAPYLADACPDCQALVTPLYAEDEPLGALVLLNSRQSGREFREPDILRARTLGDLTSLALRRVRLMEEEREAKEKAEAAVRVRDETLGIVSHDLRNPLTKIGLSAELLTDAAPEEQPELIETIRSSSRQAQRLIQDLLDVARVEAGRFSVDRAPLDPTPLVSEVCESNRPLADQKKQRIVCQIEEPLPQVIADRDRILQVFNNLIGNALKFTPDRGTITIEAKQDDGVIVFRVRDNGPGIADADLKDVFRPYWQAKKTAHMGAGLGLAIVRGIVEAHGGTVWAENAKGGGAVFTFTIPVNDRWRQSSPSSPEGNPPAR
jgi:PAS domain S-box-containing protein